MAETIQSQLQSLVLSASEVRALTGWPEPMISEWLNMIANAALISNAVDSGDTDLTDLTNRVNQLEIDVDTLGLAVTNLQTDVGNLQTDVWNLQTDVGTNTTNIATNASDILDLEQLIYIR